MARKNTTAGGTAPPGPGPARGLLRPETVAAGRFEHRRIAPAAPLNAIVEHYWWVCWELDGGPPQRRETLPHPSVHWVFESGQTRLLGLSRARFVRVLEGQGQVFGVKFLPGGFRPLLGAAVATLTGRTLAPTALWGTPVAALVAEIEAAPDADRAIALVAPFLESRLAGLPADSLAARVSQLVRSAQHDHTLLRAEQLAAQAGMGLRQLQRLFHQYVGLGPKWVLQRYRLHEVLARLDAGESAPDWTRLALDLGWFDQAHFIRDFRRLTGLTPAQYGRRP